MFEKVEDVDRDAVTVWLGVFEDESVARGEELLAAETDVLTESEGVSVRNAEADRAPLPDREPDHVAEFESVNEPVGVTEELDDRESAADAVTLWDAESVLAVDSEGKAVADVDALCDAQSEEDAVAHGELDAVIDSNAEVDG